MIKSQSVTTSLSRSFEQYTKQSTVRPLFLKGECRAVLSGLPAESIDCMVTSPPYWGHREYSSGGLGEERTHGEYVENLAAIFREIQRVLKPTGSAWLNIGDSYHNKNLAGVPWRVAVALTDQLGFVLRNDVIWHKVKGSPDNANDKLRNIHEHVFHFVKQARGYYYDDKMIRRTPKSAKVVKGAIVSATGVTGVRYERQIELSTDLTDIEKANARRALNAVLDEMRTGKLGDFRMVIRGQQRTTHSNSVKVSGRAKEMQSKGFYFLKYHPDGAKLGDVWEIIPEDTQKRQSHFAPYPRDLCRIPITATCPPGGMVLDPFCGTGTTMAVAMEMGRRSVGIDISDEYLAIAEDRCAVLL